MYNVNKKLLREVIRLLILENQDDAQNLGFEAFTMEGAFLGMVYKVGKLRQQVEIALVNNPNAFKGVFPELFYDSIIAMMAAVKPKDPCGGAWEIKNAAGRGQKLLLLDLSNHMKKFTGSEYFIPDRDYISKQGQSAWTTMRAFSTDVIPMDDKNHADVGSHKKYHTDDTKDDCEVYYLKDMELPDDIKGKNPKYLDLDSGKDGLEMLDAVNTAISVPGTGQNNFDQYQKNSEEFIKSIADRENLGMSYEQIRGILKNQALDYFRTNFKERKK